MGKDTHLCCNCFLQVTLRSHVLLSTWCCAVLQPPIRDFCTVTLSGSTKLIYIRHRHRITFLSQNTLHCILATPQSILSPWFCTYFISHALVRKPSNILWRKLKKKCKFVSLCNKMAAAFLNPCYFVILLQRSHTFSVISHGQLLTALTPSQHSQQTPDPSSPN